MAIKDIVAPMFGDASDEAVIATIEANSILRGAHVAAALVAPIPDSVYMADGYTSGMVLAELATSAHEDGLKGRDLLMERFRRTELAYEVRFVEGQTTVVCDNLALMARHADLTTMVRPSARTDGAAQHIFEMALMESGRPVLLLPPNYRGKASFSRVFVAWNAGREAARALGDAGPFLDAASDIVVGTMDARPGFRRHGESPGADIAAHLARHGYSVDVRNEMSGSEDVGEALLEAARRARADLIVLGGYSHARLQESLFGGVTRTLLETATIPLFLSH